MVFLVHCVKSYAHVFYNMNYLALIITFQGLLLYLLLGGASKKRAKGFIFSFKPWLFERDLGRYQEKIFLPREKGSLKGIGCSLTTIKVQKGFSQEFDGKIKRLKKSWLTFFKSPNKLFLLTQFDFSRISWFMTLFCRFFGFCFVFWTLFWLVKSVTENFASADWRNIFLFFLVVSNVIKIQNSVKTGQ